MREPRRVLLPCVIALLCLAAVAQAAQVPEHLRRIIAKNQSFGLTRLPVGFWNETSLKTDASHFTEAEVARWAEGGFTVTLSPEFDPADPQQVAHLQNLLAWAGKYGIKLIVSDPRAEGPLEGFGGNATEPMSLPADYEQQVATALADVKDSPAVFGFEIGEEPNHFSNDAYLAAYRAMKSAAPNLHPFLNLLPYTQQTLSSEGYPDWGDYLDTAVRKGGLDYLCYDCYTQMNAGETGWNTYFENLRLYREAAWRNGIPFWTTLLCTGHFRYRSPSLNDLRWEFNTAVASGATGILWYLYYLPEPKLNFQMPPVDENWETTSTYYNLRHVQRDFHRLYGDLFLRLAPTRVTYYPSGWGGGETFSPDEVISAVEPDQPSHPLLIGEFTDLKGQRYVMVVNNSATDSVSVMLAFPGSDVKVYSWRWNQGEQLGIAYSASRFQQTAQDLRVWHWLAPGEEIVYRVDSESTRAVRTVPYQAE